MIQTINDKTYESSPENWGCEGCVASCGSALCRQLDGCDGIIWKEVTTKETTMDKPHIHQEEIIAWAKGAAIQCFSLTWTRWKDIAHPDWLEDRRYRVKPEPKPDVDVLWFVTKTSCPIRTKAGNLRVTFDGETGDIKSAEVIK